MAKVKKGVAKRKARRKAAKRAANADPDAAPSAAAAAVEYLQQWAAREEQPWKFQKSRQTFLLQKWPDREKVTAETFRDLLLPYFQTLTAACAQRTIEQAAARIRPVPSFCPFTCSGSPVQSSPFCFLWQSSPVPQEYETALLEQARAVIEAAEAEAAADAAAAAERPPADEDEGDANDPDTEEDQRRAAFRKIRQSRALKVITTLLPLANQETGS